MENRGFFEVDRLRIGVGEAPLIEGISFAVARGEFVALHGPSGCGKTTLLRALAGLVGADGGVVRIEGRGPEEVGWPRFRRRVSLVQQRPTLLDVTVRESLARPFGYGVAGGGFDAGRAERLLESLLVPRALMDQRALSLSVGEQQRVCLVRALLVDPELVLLDEPTSALDERAAEAVARVLEAERAERGLAGLIAIHNRGHSERLCGRSIELGSFLVGGARSASGGDGGST